LATIGILTVPETALVFRVVGDGKVLWQSQPKKEPQVGTDVAVSVAGVKILRLEVDCRGPSVNGHAVWIDPRLTTVGTPSPQPSPIKGEGAEKAAPTPQSEIRNPQLSQTEILLSPDYVWSAPEKVAPNMNSP